MAQSEENLRRGLPQHLLERLRLLKTGTVSGGGLVVYWMRLALRGHENPALDAAVLAANALRAQLVVLLHVEDQYPCATARRQLFLLQGARAAQAELAQRGIRTIAQVDRNSCRQDFLSVLQQEASLLLAEEPFCVPWLAGVESLRQGRFKCPVWLVDCCSVCPSALVPKQSCHRAYAYENSTRQMHEAQLARTWEDARLLVVEDEAGRPRGDGQLLEILRAADSAAAVDLQTIDLASWVSDMDVDQRVEPVRHTIGGSAQGYTRWRAWLAAGGLQTYAKRRNDSLDVHGVSRMSAYLNAGMVSPMRIAREAKGSTGAGKTKFLNEFLTWRGLTYAWCYHFPMPASGCTLSQLPGWARETLQRHKLDRRQVISSNDLSWARSGQRAWDGMQRYLVETGELHNNARMGWGCAVVRWTASPEDALQTLIHLNNTFALDGHAPPSYGGLLGCLGLYTGPKTEAQVFGTVPARPPKDKYAQMAFQIPAILGVQLPASTKSATESFSPQTRTPLAAAVASPRSEEGAQRQVQASLQDSFLRKCVLANDGEDATARGGKQGACAANSKQVQSEVVEEKSSKKRRWSVKINLEQAALIELD